ncbi:MAG: response regulator transcription factor, partial [Gemmatimonadetes bacterium]|nr:response regulator transcription factor [Gemmatimonadota bacterium]
MLVDDHAVVRAGIKLLIELTERYDVVGEASSGEAAVERVDALKPDLVVMDIRMPGMDGITATRRITTRNPDVRVLVLTAYDDPEYVEAAIEAGAMGCLSKRRARSDLVGALDMVAAGRMTFPAHVVG